MSEAQWAADPTGRHQYRWFDGSVWTDQVGDNGVQSVDPFTPVLPAPPLAPPPPLGLPYPPGPPLAAVVVPEGTTISSRGRRFLGALLTLLLVIVTLGIGYIIWTMIVWSRGQTPAKQLMNMRVVKVDTGNVATWGDMFIRGFLIDTVLGAIPFFGLIFKLVSALWIFGNDENQRLTDKMVNTIVVDDPHNRYA